MYDPIGPQLEQVAATLQGHQAQVNPLISQILGVVGGSARRVDSDMADLLQATARSLDDAIASLHIAAQTTQGAVIAEEQIRFERERQEAQRRAQGNVWD